MAAVKLLWLALWLRLQRDVARGDRHAGLRQQPASNSAEQLQRTAAATNTAAHRPPRYSSCGCCHPCRG